ncbi:DUF4012 domain-containing protein [Candidatus Uhrbacteria bacterium]|nr:DUF4012 domain-containing protein [Candidatus Uhrbacteria bacterium]
MMEQNDHKRHFPISHTLVWICGIVVGILVLSSLFVVSASRSLSRTVDSLKGHVYQARTLVKAHNVRAAHAELQQALDDISSLQKTASSFSAAQYIPFFGKKYEAATRFLDASYHSVHAAVRVMQIVERSLQPVRSSQAQDIKSIDIETRERLLRALWESQPDIRAVRSELALALYRLRDVHAHALNNSMREMAGQLQAENEKMVTFIDNLEPFLAYIPYVVGYPHEKTYLFLLQNNSEVRGTGGFIGNYGIIKVKDGTLLSFKTDNIYNLDDPNIGKLFVEPPMPLKKYTWGSIKYLFLRDSNWSPDFTNAAKKAEWFYIQEGGKEKLDGVIAITPDVISSFLRFTGPIQIDDILFTSDNFFQELQYDVEQGYALKGIEEHRRKEMVGRLGSELISRIYSLPFDQWGELLKNLKTKLNEKSILLLFHDKAAQQFVDEYGWSGRVMQTEGDFLMVVDSNIVSMKTDLVMDKAIDYTLREHSDGSLTAQVELTYRNNGYFSWYTTRYRDWVRILIPQGSTVISSSGALERELSDAPGKLEVLQESGKMSVGAFIVVEPKRTKKFTLEYRLPKRIGDQVKDGLYTLFVQKQSGVSNQQFTGHFFFQKPLVSYNQGTFTVNKTGEKTLDLNGDLRFDRSIQIQFK